MDNDLEALESRTPVTYQSSVSFKPLDGLIFYSRDSHTIDVIARENYDLMMKPKHLDLDMLEEMLVREYKGRGTVNCTLILIYRGESRVRQQVFLQFQSRPILDKWDSSLRSFLARRQDRLKLEKRALRLSKENVNQAEVRLHRVEQSIKSLKIESPPKGLLALISVEVGWKTARLEIPDYASSSEACKKLVTEFVDMYAIMGAEVASLYKYVRFVVQRAVMERETERMTADIHNLHLDRLRVDNPRHPDGNLMTVEELDNYSVRKLGILQATLSERLGRSGVGSGLVAAILTRSIEKMKQINTVLAISFEYLNREKEEGDPLLEI